jgi:hypothetical protein
MPAGRDNQTAEGRSPTGDDDSASPRHGDDSPWKEALEGFFPGFLALLFRTAHAEIDWSQGVQFLDKEFQQRVREAKTTRRYADKLVGVTLRDGSAVWVLIHVEGQGEAETAFAERIKGLRDHLRALRSSVVVCFSFV